MKFKSFFVSVFITAFAASGFAGTQIAYDQVRFKESMDLALKHWSESNIQNYVFQFRWSCECMDAYTSFKEIHVVGGKITEITDLQNQKKLDPRDFHMYKTVDELLAMLNNAQTDGTEFIRAAFDAQWGIPMSGLIDPEVNVADEEKSFYISFLIKE